MEDLENRVSWAMSALVILFFIFLGIMVKLNNMELAIRDAVVLSILLLIGLVFFHTHEMFPRKIASNGFLLLLHTTLLASITVMFYGVVSYPFSTGGRGTVTVGGIFLLAAFLEVVLINELSTGVHVRQKRTNENVFLYLLKITEPVTFTLIVYLLFLVLWPLHIIIGSLELLSLYLIDTKIHYEYHP